MLLDCGAQSLAAFRSSRVAWGRVTASARGRSRARAPGGVCPPAGARSGRARAAGARGGAPDLHEGGALGLRAIVSNCKHALGGSPESERST